MSQKSQHSIGRIFFIKCVTCKQIIQKSTKLTEKTIYIKNHRTINKCNQ